MTNKNFLPTAPSIFDTIFEDSDILFRDIFVSKDPFHHVKPDASIKYPIMDVKHDDEYLYITFVVNGIDKKDINVSLTDDILEVKYDKPFSTKKEKMEDDIKYVYIYQKISRKSWGVKWKINKSVFDLDENKINIDLNHGELVVKIPIKEEMRPQKPIKLSIK